MTAVAVLRIPCPHCHHDYAFAVAAPGRAGAVTVDQVAWESYREGLIDIDDLLAFPESRP